MGRSRWLSGLLSCSNHWDTSRFDQRDDPDPSHISRQNSKPRLNSNGRRFFWGCGLRATSKLSLEPVAFGPAPVKSLTAQID